ncbi:DUF898 family protein [Pikeienuella sp. HZG-20]|uniref:DUF898 family protein n=1 Tax=Paludibacillus litoralis TaxID=3133267 RepID=UPI0030EBF440
MNELDQGAFRFAPAPGEVQDLILRDGAISALSFGVYRFWMNTHFRRLIWRRTTLAGDPFEYDGTALELARGVFLAVLALSVVFLLFNFALGYVGLALWDAWSPQASALLSALAFTPILEFARFGARRYRLRRTRWRGLRFGMNGSAGAFMRIWLKWALIMVLTLGLARPWLRVARERCMTEAMVYGDADFSFDGSARAIFMDWLRLWLAAVAAFAAYSIIRRVHFGFVHDGARIDVMSFLVPLIGAGLIWFVFRFWCHYRAAELRLFMTARRIKGVRISCDFNAKGLLRPAWATIGRAIVVGALLALLLFSFASLALRLAVAAEGADPAGFALSLDLSMLGRFQSFGARAIFLGAAWLNYAATVLFLIWLWQAVWWPRVHGELMAATTASGLSTLADVRQRPAETAIGAEGFADALGVAGL